MPKHLMEATFTPQGMPGVRGEGSQSRHDLAKSAVASLGRTVESFTLAFGEFDTYTAHRVARQRERRRRLHGRHRIGSGRDPHRRAADARGGRHCQAKCRLPTSALLMPPVLFRPGTARSVRCSLTACGPRATLPPFPRATVPPCHRVEFLPCCAVPTTGLRHEAPSRPQRWSRRSPAIRPASSACQRRPRCASWHPEPKTRRSACQRRVTAVSRSWGPRPDGDRSGRSARRPHTP